jgi:hypothetical protein
LKQVHQITNTLDRSKRRVSGGNGSYATKLFSGTFLFHSSHETAENNFPWKIKITSSYTA